MARSARGRKSKRQEGVQMAGRADAGSAGGGKCRWQEVRMAGSANGMKCEWQEVHVMAGSANGREEQAGGCRGDWVRVGGKGEKGKGGQSAYCTRLGVLKEGTYLVQFPVSSDIVPIPGSLIPFLGVGSEEIILYEADVESHAVSEGVEPLSPDATLI